MTKVYSKILLMNSSRNNFISLPVFYMNFGKKSHFANLRADFLFFKDVNVVARKMAKI